MFDNMFSDDAKSFDCSHSLERGAYISICMSSENVFARDSTMRPVVTHRIYCGAMSIYEICVYVYMLPPDSAHIPVKQCRRRDDPAPGLCR